MPTLDDLFSAPESETGVSPAIERPRMTLEDAVGNIFDPFGFRHAAAPAADFAAGGIGAVGQGLHGLSALTFGDQDGFLNNLGSALDRTAHGLEDFVDENPHKQYYGRSLLKALGSTAPIMTASMVNPAAGWGLSGLMSAGEAAERARAAGLGENAVAASALAGGVTGALIERMSGAPVQIANRLSGSVAKPGLRGAVQFLERIWDKGALAKEALGEGTEEALQGFTQDVIERFYNPEKDVFSMDAAVRHLQEFGIGTLAGGIVSGGMTGIDIARAADTERRLAAGEPVREQIVPRAFSDDDAAKLGAENDPDAGDESLPANPGARPPIEETDPVLTMRGGMDMKVDFETLPGILQTKDDLVLYRQAEPGDEDLLERATKQVVGTLTADLKPRRGWSVKPGDIYPTRDIPDAIKGTPALESAYTGVANLWDGTMFYVARGRRFFESLQGWKQDGAFTKFFDNWRLNSWFNYKKLSNFDDLSFTKMAETAGNGDRGWLSGQIDSTHVTPSGVQVSGAELIGLSLVADDQIAAQRVQEQGFVRPDGTQVQPLQLPDLMWAKQSLTPGQQQIREWMRNYYDQKYPTLSGVYERVNGRVLPRVSGYFPIIGNEGDVSAGLAEGMLSLFNLTTEEATDKLAKGMTKKRAEEGHRPLVLDAMTVLDYYSRTANYYIANAEMLDNFRRVANHPDFIDALNKAQGVGPRRRGDKAAGPRDAKQYLDGWIEAISRPGPVHNNTPGERMMRWLRTHGAVGVMGFKLGIVAKQAASTMSAIAEYGEMAPILNGWMKLSKAIVEEGSLLNNSVVKQAMEIAPDIEFRSIDREIDDYKRELARRGKSEFGKKFDKVDTVVTETVLAGIAAMDKLTLVANFMGIYEHETLVKNTSHAKAAQIARRVNQVTQSQSAIGDLPPFFREPGESIKIWSIFTNEINLGLNQDRAMYHRYKNGEISASDAMAFVMWRYGAIALLMAMLDMAGKPGPGDIAEAVSKQALGGLPFIGNMYGSMLYATERGLSNDAGRAIFNALPVGLSGASRSAGGVFSAAKHISKGEGITLTDATNIITGAMTQIGLPGDALRTLEQAASEYAKNPAMHPADVARALVFSSYQRRRGPLFGEPETTKKKKPTDPFSNRSDSFSKFDRKMNKTLDDMFSGDF